METYYSVIEFVKQCFIAPEGLWIRIAIVIFFGGLSFSLLMALDAFKYEDFVEYFTSDIQEKEGNQA